MLSPLLFSSLAGQDAVEGQDADGEQDDDEGQDADEVQNSRLRPLWWRPSATGEWIKLQISPLNICHGYQSEEGPKPYQTIQSEFRFGPIPTHSGHFPTQIDFVSFASWGAAFHLKNF